VPDVDVCGESEFKIGKSLSCGTGVGVWLFGTGL